MADASVADWVTAVGTMLAGLAAVGAVIVGGFTAKAWRPQARAAKEAELAGEALVAAVQALRAARRTCAGYRTAPDMAGAVHNRWAELVDPSKATLQAIAARSTAFLPTAPAEFLLDVLKHLAALHADQWVWALRMDSDTSTPEDFRDVFGDHRGKALEELEARAIALLRPLARFEHR